MSKANDYEQDILKLLLNGTAIANVADNAGSAPITEVWCALHTASPGEAGTLGSNEVSYTGYSRVSVTRSTAGWAITSGTTAGASAVPVSAIEFGQNTSTSTGTITHFSIGQTSATTAGRVFYYGTVTPNIAFAQNVTPRLTTGSSIRED